MSQSNPALILILHGSPNPESSAPALHLCKRLRESGRFHVTMLAFMECNEPTIPAAIDRCVDSGARTIIAVPYLLHTGRHLVIDVPRILMEAAARHPQVSVKITDPVGAASGISDALKSRALESL